MFITTEYRTLVHCICTDCWIVKYVD